jgi:hypothetical protein
MFGSDAGGDQQSFATGEDGQSPVECITVMESLRIIRRSDEELLLEWDGDIVDDVLADAVVALILDIESHPVSVKSMCYLYICICIFVTHVNYCSDD